MRSSILSLRTVVLVSTMFAAMDAEAVPVTINGGAVVPPGTTAAANPALAGPVLADTVSHWESADDPLYGFPGATGTLQSRVVRETLTGTLDFYWRLTVDGVSYPNDVPTDLNLYGLPVADLLTGGAYDVDYRLDGLGTVAPGSVSASPFVLSYTFDPQTLGPNQSSYFLLLHSNATSYFEGATASFGNSDIPTYAPAFMPVPVPEPDGSTLLMAGLAALGGLWRRRQRGA